MLLVNWMTVTARCLDLCRVTRAHLKREELSDQLEILPNDDHEGS